MQSIGKKIRRHANTIIVTVFVCTAMANAAAQPLPLGPSSTNALPMSDVDWNRILNIGEVLAGVFAGIYLAWDRFVKTAIHRAVRPLQAEIERPPLTDRGQPIYENLRTTVDDIRDRLNDIAAFYRGLDNRLHLAEEQRIELAQEFHRESRLTNEHVLRLDSDMVEARRLIVGVQASVVNMDAVMKDIAITLKKVSEEPK